MRTKVTKYKFNNVKQAIERKFWSNGVTCKFFHISISTLNKIKKADTFEEYLGYKSFEPTFTVTGDNTKCFYKVSNGKCHIKVNCYHSIPKWYNRIIRWLRLLIKK